MLKLSSGSRMLRLGLRLSIGSCMLRLGSGSGSASEDGGQLEPKPEHAA